MLFAGRFSDVIAEWALVDTAVLNSSPVQYNFELKTVVQLYSISTYTSTCDTDNIDTGYESNSCI